MKNLFFSVLSLLVLSSAVNAAPVTQVVSNEALSVSQIFLQNGQAIKDELIEEDIPTDVILSKGVVDRKGRPGNYSDTYIFELITSDTSLSAGCLTIVVKHKADKVSYAISANPECPDGI